MTKETTTKEKYIETVGRRKTSTARVRLTPAAKMSVTVNGKELAEYFKTEALQKTALSPIELSGTTDKFNISVMLTGGGISSQAGAFRHGLARGIEKSATHLRGVLKKEGLLTRDPRAKERRKFGLKKARKRYYASVTVSKLPSMDVCPTGFADWFFVRRNIKQTSILSSHKI